MIVRAADSTRYRYIGVFDLTSTEVKKMLTEDLKAMELMSL